MSEKRERSNMRMKQSDVMDRWTILLMKARVDQSAKAELEEYQREGNDIFSGTEWRQLLPWIMQLMEANAKIWVLESAIRNGKDMPAEEVGRRAIEIREYNKLRVAAKHSIDAWFGQSPDVKVDHASA
jgi:hypothetical protein